MIVSQLRSILQQLPPTTRLVAVSKFHSVEEIMEAYNAGQRLFGESRVQELCDKYPQLPTDIEWHFIGPLQRNKVKYIAPFVALIQSLDSPSLFAEILKQAKKNQRPLPCLLEIKIATEATKGGWTLEELTPFLEQYGNTPEWQQWVPLRGVMGMATFTDNTQQIQQEFASLHSTRNELQEQFPFLQLTEISMGMSGDWPEAIRQGSTLIRVGSAIFGERRY